MINDIRVKNTATLPVAAQAKPRTRQAAESGSVFVGAVSEQDLLSNAFMKRWGMALSWPKNIFYADHLTKKIKCPNTKESLLVPLKLYHFPKIHPTRGFYTLRVSLPQDKASFALAKKIARQAAGINRLQNRPIKEIIFNYEGVGLFSAVSHHVALTSKKQSPYLSFEQQTRFLLAHEILHGVYYYGLESHLKDRPLAKDAHLEQLYQRALQDKSLGLMVDESSHYPTCGRIGHYYDGKDEFFASSMGIILVGHSSLKRYYEAPSASQKQKRFIEDLVVFYEAKVDPDFKVWKSLNPKLDPREALPIGQ